MGLWGTINEYKYHTSRKTYSSVTSEQPSDFPMPEHDQGIRAEWFHESSMRKWVFSVFGQCLLVAHMSQLNDLEFSTAWRQSQILKLGSIWVYQWVRISRADLINVARRLVWLISSKIRDNCSIGGSVARIPVPFCKSVIQRGSRLQCQKEPRLRLWKGNSQG